MAKLIKGILGPVIGNLGPITGSTWKNVTYIKERPAKVNKKQKRSTAQDAVLQKFRFIQHFLAPFRTYLNIGFARMAKNKTEINVAFSLNYNTAFTGTWPDIKVEYANLKLSSGRLAGLPGLQLQRTAPLRLELTWEKTVVGKASPDDQLMLVVYSPELKTVDGFIGGIKRNALYCSFNLNSRFAKQELEVYLSMTSVSRKSISESIYLGRVSI